MPKRLAVVVFGSLIAAANVAGAGTVIGKLELPSAPERPPSGTRGFLDRVENPLAPARRLAVTAEMIVVLEGAKPSAPGQVTWELVGDSFARRVVGVPLGAEVVIKNVTRNTARTLVAAEDPKLIPAGPINPTGSKSFRPAAAGQVFTVGDKDAPHLKGVLVVVDSPYVANVDDNGKFEIDNVAEGSYKLRVFYKNAWLDVTTDVTVGKGKTEVNPKVPALPVAPGKK
ncbi:MAG TPA: hypothetical protein VM513_02660 [Kofleriaceae bacterium]|jgi:hypothetical protein|nr:hypothetical protein [Kofleriaceae bacterium]